MSPLRRPSYTGLHLSSIVCYNFLHYFENYMAICYHVWYQQIIYCGIIVILGGQCSWIAIILPVLGDVTINLSVSNLLNYNTGQFITLLNVCGDIYTQVKATQEIDKHLSPVNNDDSTVYDKRNLNFEIYHPQGSWLHMWQKLPKIYQSLNVVFFYSYFYVLFEAVCCNVNMRTIEHVS